MHRGRDRGRHINFLELAAVHKTIASFEAALRGSSVLLFEDNMTVVHVLTNRTSRSPELMHELRRLWRLIDTLGIDLSVRYIPTDANTMADALSRGAPTDELTLTDAAFFELDRRWGPHTIDQYASAANARLPRFHTAFPDAKGLGAGAMAHDWSGENNYAFPPLAELPRVAQLLFERPSIACTVVAPYWPTQAWFQQLVDVSLHVEICAASTVSTLPPALHASARHAMAGATLAFIRVPGCLRGGGRTARS